MEDGHAADLADDEDGQGNQGDVHGLKVFKAQLHVDRLFAGDVKAGSSPGDGQPLRSRKNEQDQNEGAPERRGMQIQRRQIEQEADQKNDDCRYD